MAMLGTVECVEKQVPLVRYCWCRWCCTIEQDQKNQANYVQSFNEFCVFCIDVVVAIFFRSKCATHKKRSYKPKLNSLFFQLNRTGSRQTFYAWPHTQTTVWTDLCEVSCTNDDSSPRIECRIGFEANSFIQHGSVKWLSLKEVYVSRCVNKYCSAAATDGTMICQQTNTKVISTEVKNIFAIVPIQTLYSHRITILAESLSLSSSQLRISIQARRGIIHFW